MPFLDCLVDHVPYAMVFNLERLTSLRGGAVLATDISTVTVNSNHGYCDIPLALAFDPASVDVVTLGMDWFKVYVSTTSFRPGNIRIFVV